MTESEFLEAMAPYEVASSNDRNRWLEARRDYVTASDCAAAIPSTSRHMNREPPKKTGTWHEYKARHELVAEKRDRVLGPDNFWMRNGRRAEPFVLQGAVEEWGWKVISPNRLYRHHTQPSLAATPDAVRVTEGGEPVHVQVKFTKCHYKTWCNALPSYIVHQVQAELSVLEPVGVKRGCVLAYHVFDRDMPLRVHAVQPNGLVQAVILNASADLMGEVRREVV